MPADAWSPDLYARFGAERAQPFRDLLALVRPRPGMRVVDLGCGTGELTAEAHRALQARETLGLDASPSMLEKAVPLAGSGLSFVRGDIAAFAGRGFDLVLSNPPYRKQGEGKISPKAGRDLARHESTASLTDFLAVSKRMVRPGGSVCMIYHPERLSELLAACLGMNLCPVRLQMVHGDFSLPARMFLVEMLKGKKGALQVLPPISVKESIYGEYQQAGMRRER